MCRWDLNPQLSSAIAFLHCSYRSKRIAARERKLTVQIPSAPLPNQFFYAPLLFCKHFLRLKIKEKAARGTILGTYTKRLVTKIKMLKIILHVMQNTHIVYG